jgi:hypothetical protein
MTISAGLAIVGVLLVMVQLVWTPGDGVPMLLVFAPVAFGLTALAAAIVLGLVRGSWLYRTAISIGVLGLIVIAAGLLLPLDRGAAGPRESPTNADIAVAAGLLLSVLSSIAGAVAITRRGRIDSAGPDRSGLI